MSARRLLALLAAPLVLAAILAGICSLRLPHFSVSLYELIGREAERIPAFLREASASEVAIVITAADAQAAERAAQRFIALPEAKAHAVPPGALEFIRANRGGLVAPETAERLATAEGRKVLARRALRRLYQSPVPPLLGYEDDPFGLVDSFLMDLSGTASGRTLAGGFPILATNGVTRILVKATFDPGEFAGVEGNRRLYRQLQELAQTLPDREVEVRFAGAPIHAAISAAKSKSEIGLLTWFSLGFIALLALVVFRSWRWIPLLGASLLVSALAGGIALAACFAEVHVMTLVFGTTVLGLIIDYSFHWLLSPAAEKPLVRRNLLVSFLTTEISLAPLMLATIPVLRQSAVFLGVGLAAALAYVVACYPQDGVRGSVVQSVAAKPALRWPRSLRTIVLLGLGLSLLVALAGLARVQLRTEASALYRPPAELAEAERQRAQFGEFDWAKLPSLAERRQNAENIRRLYAEQGAELAKTLELRELVPPPEPTDCLARPQALLAEIFAAWTVEAAHRLAWAVLVLFVVLAGLCRRRALDILAPPLAALLVVAGVLGWCGEPVNLFHVLAAFLLLGMGIDYAVFLREGGANALKPAVSSLLTSLAGFGALAFVSFPVVAAFGVVLGLGLPVSFLLALALRLKAQRGETQAAPSVEKGASPLGLDLLFLVYRVLGLRALHLIAALVGVCLWTFSPAVRRASPRLRKVVNFTRSLADKLVVMAEGRRLPKVETDGSEDAAAFVADVSAGKGVFILSSHLGTVEVLTALGDCERTFHAWMDFDRTAVFSRFYLHHARRQRVVIHPISGFGMQTVFEAGDLIDGGDCLVMAGDRGDGAFRFAAAFGHPIYFVACLATGGSGYRAVIRRLPASRRELKPAYEAILAELVRQYPAQHFVWQGA